MQKQFNYTTITSFKKACKSRGENPTAKKFTTGATDTRAYEMLKVIIKAINGPEYEADYANSDQRKYEILFSFDKETSAGIFQLRTTKHRIIKL